MINVKPEVFEALKKIVPNVTDAYPKDWTNFPVVVYLENENKPSDVTSSGEASSDISYTVHIWDKKSISDIAVKIDAAFVALGFKRTTCQDVPDNQELRHKLMRFNGVVDVDTLRVYHKNYYND